MGVVWRPALLKQKSSVSVQRKCLIYTVGRRWRAISCQKMHSLEETMVGITMFLSHLLVYLESLPLERFTTRLGTLERRTEESGMSLMRISMFYAWILKQNLSG